MRDALPAIVNAVALIVVALIGKAKLARIGSSADQARDSADQARDSAEQARTQLRPNGGSTAMDAIQRVETVTRDIADALGRLDSRTARIGDEVSQGRREALADRNRLDALTERVDEAVKEHSTFRSQLDRLLHRRS